MQVAEKLRVQVAQVYTETSQGSINVTISLGVAALHPRCANIEMLVENADRALYDAKHQGRNRVTAWEEC